MSPHEESLPLNLMSHVTVKIQLLQKQDVKLPPGSVCQVNMKQTHFLFSPVCCPTPLIPCMYVSSTLYSLKKFETRLVPNFPRREFLCCNSRSQIYHQLLSTCSDGGRTCRLTASLPLLSRDFHVFCSYNETSSP